MKTSIRQLIKEAIDEYNSIEQKGEHNDSPENLCPRCHNPLTKGMGADVKHCEHCGHIKDGETNPIHKTTTNTGNMSGIFEHLTPRKLAALMELFIRNDNKIDMIYEALSVEGFVPINESTNVSEKRRCVREMIQDGRLTKDMLKTLAEHNHIVLKEYDGDKEIMPTRHSALTDDNIDALNRKGYSQGSPVDSPFYWESKKMMKNIGSEPIITPEEPDDNEEGSDIQPAPVEMPAAEMGDTNNAEGADEFSAGSDEAVPDDEIVAGLSGIGKNKEMRGQITNDLGANLQQMRDIASGLGFGINEYLQYVQKYYSSLAPNEQQDANHFLELKNKNKELTGKMQQVQSKIAPPVAMPETQPMEMSEAKKLKSELALRAGANGKIFESRMKRLESYKKLALLEFFETDVHMLDEQDYGEMALLTGINEDDIIAMRIEYENRSNDLVNEITYPVIGKEVHDQNEQNAKKQQTRDIKQANKSQETTEEKVYNFKEKKFRLADVNKNIAQTDKEDQNRGQGAQAGFIMAKDPSQKEKYEMQANGDTNPRAKDATDANVGDGKVYGSEGTTDVGADLLKKGERQEIERQEEPTYPKEDVPMRRHQIPPPKEDKMGVNRVNEDLERMKGLFGYNPNTYASTKNKKNPNLMFEQQLNDLRVLSESVDTSGRPTKEQLMEMDECDFQGKKRRTDGTTVFNEEGEKIGECEAMEEARGHALEAGQEIEPKQLYTGSQTKKRIEEYDIAKLEEEFKGSASTGKKCTKCGHMIYKTKKGLGCMCDDPTPEKENIHEAEIDRMRKLAGMNPIDESKRYQLRHSKGQQLRTGTPEEEISEVVEPLAADAPEAKKDEKLITGETENEIEEAKRMQLQKGSKGMQLKTGTKTKQEMLDEAKNKQLAHSKGLQFKTGTKTKEDVVEGQKKKLSESFIGAPTTTVEDFYKRLSPTIRDGWVDLLMQTYGSDIKPHTVLRTEMLTDVLRQYHDIRTPSDDDETTINEDELAKGGRGDFQQKVKYIIYSKEYDFLGYIENTSGENEDQWNNMYDKSEVLSTPSFAKFAQEKGITANDIGKVGRERYAAIDGNELDKEHYAPSDSEEWFDPKTNTYYNSSGQRLRNPQEYDRGGEGYTPFGDEGNNY